MNNPLIDLLEQELDKSVFNLGMADTDDDRLYYSNLCDVLEVVISLLEERD